MFWADENLSEDKTVQLYAFFSLISSVILWAGFHLFTPADLFYDNFSITLFLLFNLYFFFHTDQFSLKDRANKKRTKVMSLYLLGQTLLLVGVGLEERIVTPLFLALVPCVVKLYISRSKIEKRKGQYLVAFVLVGILFLGNFYGKNTSKNYFEFMKDAVIFSSFIIWALGLTYFSIIWEKKSLLSRLFIIKKDFKQTPVVELRREGRSIKDRLFFHDIINHTHSLNLFLNFKMSLGLGLNNKELEIVVNENKAIQAMFQDHFKLKHKNLVNSYIHISLSEMKKRFQHLISNYLPPHMVKCKIEFAEGIDYAGQIHYPIFWRIMTNLIKNISEEQTDEVNITFNYDENGLEIVLKNRIFNLAQDRVNLAENLQKTILDESPCQRAEAYSGIGLESVTFLVESQGGQCSFSCVDSYWVTEVFLPWWPRTEKSAA